MAKKLKVEDIPDGYEYAAVDADGFAYAFKDRPIICDDKHDVPPFNFGHHKYIGKGFDASDWQNSLIFKGCNKVKADPKKLHVYHIPRDLNWAAIDKDGSAWAFKQKPKINEETHTWFTETPEYLFEIGEGFDASDWQNSLISREPEQKPELKKLTAADIPDGYNFAAVDASGNGFTYQGKPKRLNTIWVNTDDMDHFLIGQFDPSDWANSLVSRTTAERPEPKKLTAADIPEGYNYAAVYSSGNTVAYKTKPVLFAGDFEWFCYTNDSKGIGVFDASDWQNSLVSRENIETEPAYKETNNKLSYSEIDPYFLEAMARRMNEGKRKYGPNNWKKLSNINELLDAAQRHLLELRKMMEDDFEPIPGQETDLQHCAALACNAMFIHYHLNPNT